MSAARPGCRRSDCRRTPVPRGCFPAAPRRSRCAALQVAEVLEPLDARRDDDQQVSVGGWSGSESMHGARRDDNQITLACGKDAPAREQFRRTRHDVKQLGPGVVLRCRPGGALQEGYPLAAEHTAGRAALCIQPAGHRRGANDFGGTLAHHHDIARRNHPGHANHLAGIAHTAQRRRGLELTRATGPGGYRDHVTGLRAVTSTTPFHGVSRIVTPDGRAGIGARTDAAETERRTAVQTAPGARFGRSQTVHALRARAAVIGRGEVEEGRPGGRVPAAWP